MTYEQLLERLKTSKFTLGHMIALRKKGLFSKLSKLNMDEETVKEMTEDEAMDATMEMVEIMAEIIYILVRPKEMTAEDITYLIPMDEIESLTTVLTEAFDKMTAVKKN